MITETDLLERLKSTASGGLCQLTHEGARAVLKSIRELCEVRLDGLAADARAAAAAPAPVIEPWMLEYGVSRLVKNGSEHVIIAMGGWATEHPLREAKYLHALMGPFVKDAA